MEFYLSELTQFELNWSSKFSPFLRKKIEKEKGEKGSFSFSQNQKFLPSTASMNI